jgi:hypothetical protein
MRGSRMLLKRPSSRFSLIDAEGGIRLQALILDTIQQQQSPAGSAARLPPSSALSLDPLEQRRLEVLSGKLDLLPAGAQAGTDVCRDGARMHDYQWGVQNQVQDAQAPGEVQLGSMINLPGLDLVPEAHQQQQIPGRVSHVNDRHHLPGGGISLPPKSLDPQQKLQLPGSCSTNSWQSVEHPGSPASMQQQQQLPCSRISTLQSTGRPSSCLSLPGGDMVYSNDAEVQHPSEDTGNTYDNPFWTEQQDD